MVIIVPVPPGVGDVGGAVKVAVALPSLSVTSDLGTSVPKSWTTPPTAMTRRSAWFAFGPPFSLRTVTTMLDCDAPSWLMLSGVAVTVTDVAKPDGPVGVGAVV
jgi:hypothetical protein